MRFATAALCIVSATAWAGCGGTEEPRAETPGQPVTGAIGEPGEPVERELVRGETRPREIDEDAARILRKMTTYLGGLPAFSFEADHATEVVLDSGQKLQLVASSFVQVRRPNGLRSHRRGEVLDVVFLYDGKTFTAFGKNTNKYVQVDAPSTLDRAIDFARQHLALEAPGSDLLYPDAYDILLEDVVSGMRVGPATVDGVECQHLAFRGNNVDWQIWIEDDATPLPLRFVITTKDVKSLPEFAVELHDWNTSPTFTNDVFTFTPPPGATQVPVTPGEDIDALARILPAPPTK